MPFEKKSIPKKDRSPSSIEAEMSSHPFCDFSFGPQITLLRSSISLFGTSDHRPLVATSVLCSLRSLRLFSIVFILQLRTFSRKGCHFQPNALKVSPFLAINAEKDCVWFANFNFNFSSTPRL
ncbi:hypothetical protein SLE2022_014130 [Rubroshorea leprosula]